MLVEVCPVLDGYRSNSLAVQKDSLSSEYT